MKNKNILYAAIATAALLVGCSEDFLTRPPEDALVDVSYYKNDEQVLSATAPLYSAVWKSYIDKANFKLGDIRGGTLFRAWNDRDAVEFNITGVSSANEEAYKSFYVVVGQSNLAIYNINKYATAQVSEAIKNHALGEAHFMRATAYTHLVMNYGAVPIIENNIELLTNPYLKRNTVESVWEFIKRDYEFAAANLLEESVQTGRLTKWSAEGMLARTHLTLAGVGKSGSRDAEHLAKAKEYADRVITMSGKSLLPEYAKLFEYPYDNNVESLFELQWVFSLDPDAGYDAANTMVSQITYSNDIAANGDGWGGDLGASWWMLSLYEGLMVNNGATAGFTLDERLKATFMLPGFHYPEISKSIKLENGEDSFEELIFPNPTEENSFASIKKYVVGKARDVGGDADRQRYPNNTYMLRLAEMYLIAAEAMLGNNESTSDQAIIDYFNKTRARAYQGDGEQETGLWNIEDDGPLTWDAIFEERIKEFAMESMAWYDIVRLHYYNPEKAYLLIEGQDRGTFGVTPNQWPDPTAWTFTQNGWVSFRKVANADAGNFQLPFPASELSQAPSLNDEPVPYEFTE